MTSKPEGPAKDPSRPSDAGKRPHATLDLKATEIKAAQPAPKADARAGEIKSGDIKSGEAKPGETKPGDLKSSEATAAKSPASKPAETKPADAKPVVGAGGATKVGDAAKPSDASKPSTAAPSPAKTSSGRFSHFLASLAGGAVALAGAYGLDQQGLIPRAETGAPKAEALEQRLAALEQSAKTTAADPALAGRIDGMAERVAKLEGLASGLEQVAAEQGRLSAETKALGEKIAGTEPVAATDERLKKLEDQIATLASAAGTEGDRAGRIANLAAITGRIGDIESRIDSQIAAVRQSIPEEISGRLGLVSEASETARATSQRLDRDVQSLRSDVVRLGQRAEELKAGDDRLTQTLDVLKEEQGRLGSEIGTLKDTFEKEIKSVARPEDVSKAVTPVADRLAKIEGSIEGVVRNEQERKADAERIVIALELANLKRAVDSGKGYAEELAAVRKAAGDRTDLALLDRFQTSGLASIGELEREFRAVANGILDAMATPADGGVVDRLMAGARSVVRVRKVNPSPDDTSVEAVVARMEAALAEGRLADALEYSKGLPDKAAGRASEWRVKAEARYEIDKAIAGLEAQLKTSLAGAAGAPPAPPAGSN